MNNSEQPANAFIYKNEDEITVCQGLTKREYACIKLGIPETGDEVLDDLIRKAERKKFAGLAMQGLLANSAENDTTIYHILKTIGLQKETEYIYEVHYPMYIAKIATLHADALLKQLENQPK